MECPAGCLHNHPRPTASLRHQHRSEPVLRKDRWLLPQPNHYVASDGRISTHDNELIKRSDMNVTLKSITPTAVCQAATTLILAEGGTSTLVVQQFLRNRGYRAYQDEVSKCLSTVASQQGWTINDNGLFQVYYFPTLSAVPQ